MRKTLIAAIVAAAGLLGHSAGAQAQAWPTRTVRFVIPFGAGAGADIGARLVQEPLQKKWGQPIVIENRPGGDGLVAIAAFMNANDDHTLLFAATGSFTVHPYQHEKLAYNLERDILPIARVSNTIIAVAVQSQGGARTFKEFVEQARANPGKFNAALVPGITEFVWDGFVHGAGLKIAKVPYRDIVQAPNDLAEGRLQVVMASVAILQPQSEAGRIRVVGVNSPKPVPFVKGVPSLVEEGFKGLELEGLVGLLGPKMLSRELRERIGKDVVAAAGDPEISKKLIATGQAVNPAGAAEFEAAIKRQGEQIAAIAKALGMPRKSP